ncbi:beta-1,6-N-acetylglucosaminyltransferase [Calothrix sp. PCC 7507]|uniref:beta-1,6-N-acetylglucosaminyltransferase n=1 Tax=Calothrix sp. PCC 7507 TaxID=99598 RepID=UPI00029F3B31|nr:beta-1,6-N-acetylglucosaminyltransferase [Calothrix sp. PCC 7507]AFY35649.1 glycosyl transferase family 14 [Calothrix sp. PCC 7507]
MKIAYLMLAHKLPEQLARLVNALNNEESHFFIHLDARATTLLEESKKCLSSFENVHFVPKRYKCRWGQFSIVRGTISCLETLVTSGIEFDYVFLLSGQDYPIKSISHIESFLEKNRGKQFINCFSLEEENEWSDHPPPFEPISRAKDLHLFFRSRVIHLPIRRKFPNNFSPYGGSQWWTLSRDCINWMTKFMRDNPGFVNYFKYTFIPDELFFHSMIMNSPFKEDIIDNSLRYVDFTRANPTRPAVLGVEDFEFLQNGTSALFARKFDISRDSKILDLIDEKIINAPRFNCL